MGEIVFAGIVPHPPIMVPEVGRGEEAKVDSTLTAMDKLAARLAEARPELVIIISPHGAVFSDGVAINGSPVMHGNLGQFRAPQVKFEVTNDLDFVELLVEEADKQNILAISMEETVAKQYDISLELDHGVTVPLYFLSRKGINLPMVMVSMSMLPPLELYRFGISLQRAAKKSVKRVAIVASGDLSHKLTSQAPAGYAPEGKELDEKIIQFVKVFDVKSLVNLDPVLAERGGECGWRSILMMLGALDGYKVESEVLSYEGPFGVGYMVASMIPGGQDEASGLLETLEKERDNIIKQRRAGESAFVKLAREALELFIRDEKVLKTPNPLPETFQESAGVFVSLKKNGQLRGCIGTIGPTKENLAEEIITNAISAGTGDPRFSSVEPEELGELVYSVDVLKEPESISGLAQLDPQRYGVIVRKGSRKGLLLPNLEGVNTAEEQVAIAKQKAGIRPDEQVELERFEVIRYH